MVTRTTRRYFGTLILGLGLVLGWVLVADWLITVEAPTWMFQVSLLIGLAAFVVAAFFTAQEKGRSVAWVVAVMFVAPLLLVLLLVPYVPGRRAELDDATAL